jgi:hypothetical protein
MKLLYGVFMKNRLPSFKIANIYICIAVAGLLNASHAIGGVQINFEIADLQAPPGEKKGVGRISADTGNSLLKFENDRNKQEESMTMIFNQKKQTLEMYDHRSKNKRVMDKKSVQEMNQKMQGYKSQFDAMMKNMTDEQRAMMQQMGRGPRPPANMQSNSGPKKMKFVKTRKRDKVMRLPCTVYEVFSGSGEKQMDMCVTDAGNIPDGKDVKKLMGGLGEFYKEVFSSMPVMGRKRAETPFEDFNKVDGFPIKTTRYERGKPIEVTTVTSVKKVGFKPKDFNPFPDYPAVGMMDLGQDERKKMRRSRRPKVPEGMPAETPGGSRNPPSGFKIPGQKPGQPLDLQKLLEGLQQQRR